jgi:S-DNA-T family DNA segregation ATPase FtsK/SpoIIIE
VITSSRASGPVGRLLDGLARRALLRVSSRVEHIAAGGESGAFDMHRPPGRAWVDGCDVQVCWTDPAPMADEVRAVDAWRPRLPLSGVVAPAAEATRAALSIAHPGCQVVSLAQLAGTPGGPDAGDKPLVLVGDPEEWRSQWGRLQGIRTQGELVIAAECASELRQLAGVRETPPFARSHERRAWAVEPGRRPRRVRLG